MLQTFSLALLGTVTTSSHHFCDPAHGVPIELSPFEIFLP